MWRKIYLFIAVTVISDINESFWWSVCLKLHERSLLSCRNHIVKQCILAWLSLSQKVLYFPHRLMLKYISVGVSIMRRQTIRALIFLAIESINMSLCFIIQLALPAGLFWFWLIARSLMLTQFLVNFLNSILICMRYTSFWISNFLSLSYRLNLKLDEFFLRSQNYRDILIFQLSEWGLQEKNELLGDQKPQSYRSPIVSILL